MGAGRSWHLVSAYPVHPPISLQHKPMGTPLGGGVAGQPVPFPVQLPSWGRGCQLPPVEQMLSEAAVSASTGPRIPPSQDRGWGPGVSPCLFV